MRIDAAGAVDAAKTRAKSCCQRGPLPFTEVTTWMLSAPPAAGSSSTSRSPEPTQPARARPRAGAPAGNSKVRFPSQRLPSPPTGHGGQAIEEKTGGQQVGGAAGRSVQRQQAAVQLAQAATPGETGAAAGGEHRAGAILHRGEADAAGAVQHAGIVEDAHDRQQRIEPGVLLASAAFAAAP